MTLQQSIIEQLASNAIRVGADVLNIEYKSGYEEVFAMCGNIGRGIASLKSTSPEAESLRAELQAMVRRNRHLPSSIANTNCDAESTRALARTPSGWISCPST